MALTELIAILAFVGILVFILAFYFLFRQRQEHGKLIERLAEPDKTVALREEIETANSGIKKSFLSVLRSLSPIARPKSEDQVSYLRKKFLKAGLRGEYALIFFWGAKVFTALALLALVILVNLLFIRESFIDTTFYGRSDLVGPDRFLFARSLAANTNRQKERGDF